LELNKYEAFIFPLFAAVLLAAHPVGSAHSTDSPHTVNKYFKLFSD
jgi:hypothetical protein